MPSPATTTKRLVKDKTIPISAAKVVEPKEK
jgi:hypothetical protein